MKVYISTLVFILTSLHLPMALADMSAEEAQERQEEIELLWESPIHCSIVGPIGEPSEDVGWSALLRIEAPTFDRQGNMQAQRFTTLTLLNRYARSLGLQPGEQIDMSCTGSEDGRILCELPGAIGGFVEIDIESFKLVETGRINRYHFGAHSSMIEGVPRYTSCGIYLRETGV